MRRLERPMVPVLADMEMAGIRSTASTLKRMSNAFAQKMAGLEDEIQSWPGALQRRQPQAAGRDPVRPKMGLSGGKQGKTGAYSTSADVLEDLAAEGHELPARGAGLAPAFQAEIDLYRRAATREPETGRVHTSYSIAGAQTGRLASTDPNLQNIPVRTEEGRRIREAFRGDAGACGWSVWITARSSCAFWPMSPQIPALKQAFRDGVDIHAMTASQMFGVPVEGMDPMIRRRPRRSISG
jgi:DNA polymerase-1